VKYPTEVSNKNFIEYTKRRAWRDDVNLAYAKPTKAGVLERYYLDLAVNSAEGIIVESLPLLETPLVREKIPSVIYDGGVLDLASIDYTVEEDDRDKFAYEKSLLIGLADKKTTINTTVNQNSITRKFIEVWNYLQVCFGKSRILTPKTPVILPNAITFE